MVTAGAFFSQNLPTEIEKGGGASSGFAPWNAELSTARYGFQRNFLGGSPQINQFLTHRLVRRRTMAAASRKRTG